MTKELSLKYIIRHEKQGNSYHVRFQGAGKTMSFPDSLYGGKEKALAAAIKWRDQMIKKNPDWARGYSERSEKEWGRARRNNSTGVDCVSIYKRPENGTIFIQVLWRNEDRKLRRKTYTIGKKYTLEEAFCMAVQDRYKHTSRDIGDLDFSKVRTAYECLLNGDHPQ